VKKAPARYTLEADLLNTLAHPTRLQILDLLRAGEACVCHIQAALRQRQAYVSQHLMALRQAGLVASRKEGLRVFYQLNEPRVVQLLENVESIVPAPGGRGQSSADLIPPPGHCNCPRCLGEAAPERT